jgi:alanine dehydrogenase
MGNGAMDPQLSAQCSRARCRRSTRAGVRHVRRPPYARSLVAIFPWVAIKLRRIMTTILHLGPAELAARLERRALIAALDRAFRLPHSIPVRQHYQIEPANPRGSGGTLLTMPAWNAAGSLGVKIVTYFADNAGHGLPTVHASYLVMDAATGRPRAMLDGTELTLRRTGAASALASRYLSAREASRLLMVGTGSLAPHLIESHILVRPIREVRIWGRRVERARALAASLAGNGLSVEVAEDLESAARWADIISCATLSQRPLVLGAWLRPGQHLDLVGAFTPQMCEVDDEAVARSQVYVDTRAGALKEAGEIIGAITIRGELSELGTDSFARSGPSDITLFKSVGTALEDLAAAELALAGSDRTRIP